VLAALGIDAPGAKQVFYGAALLFVVVLMPHGIWPPLAKLLGLDKQSSAPRPGKGEAP
jgi:branched-chain amino acid transport system permease protein